MGAWVKAVIEAGGDCVKVREGGCAVMVVKATAGFAADVVGLEAIIVTTPPAGTELGAV
jgi:hypothetical protein